MLTRRVVSAEEIEKFSRAYNLEYFESSAQERININEIFESGARKVLEKINSSEINVYDEVDLKAWNKNWKNQPNHRRKSVRARQRKRSPGNASKNSTKVQKEGRMLSNHVKFLNLKSQNLTKSKAKSVDLWVF